MTDRGNCVLSPLPLDLPSCVPAPLTKGVVCPRLQEIDWGDLAQSESLVAAIEAECFATPAQLLESVAEIARLLAPLHAMGCGGVQPWGLRLLNGQVRLALLPDYGPQARRWGDGLCAPATHDRARCDLFLLGLLLFRGAFGFWPRTGADALNRLALVGGELPLGFDTAIRYGLGAFEERHRTEAKGLLQLIQAFELDASPGDVPLRLLCAGDTLTGPGKAGSTRPPIMKTDSCFTGTRMARSMRL